MSKHHKPRNKPNGPAVTGPAPSPGGPAFEVAPSLQPDRVSLMGWTAAQGLAGAYKFADDGRRDANKD